MRELLMILEGIFKGRRPPAAPTAKELELRSLRQQLQGSHDRLRTLAESIVQMYDDGNLSKEMLDALKQNGACPHE